LSNPAIRGSYSAMLPKKFRLILALMAVATAVRAGENELTETERAAGWQLLFDGKTMNGWRGYRNTAVAGWEVVEGTLHIIANSRGANLVTEKKYSDFELSWEWKLPHAGNNGVKYMVTEERPSAPGPEYQMLDDNNHPDGRRGPRFQTASFYEVLPPAADKPSKPMGEWNTSRIVVRGDRVEHWLNGRQVLAFQLDSEEVKAGIARSKFAREPGFGDKIAGHIMLTYHSDDCWYRNIKIRELK
jgi:hypothetical protein